MTDEELGFWLIKQNANQSYATFESAVVVAATEDAARRMHPGDGADITKHSLSGVGWVGDPELVTAIYLGPIKDSWAVWENGDVVCASYLEG